jgi:hypothetical protein
MFNLDGLEGGCFGGRMRQKSAARANNPAESLPHPPAPAGCKTGCSGHWRLIWTVDMTAHPRRDSYFKKHFLSVTLTY